MPRTLDREEEFVLGTPLEEPRLLLPGANPTTGRPGLRDLPNYWAGAIKVQAADLDSGIIAGSNLTGNQRVRRMNAQVGTIATTGTGLVLIRCDTDGTIGAITITAGNALSANDTNYLTFTANNRGTGAGNVALLTATDSNTTKATGGSAFVAKTPHALAGNAANFAVVGGDVLELAWAVTGTLANTLTSVCVTISLVTT